MIEFLVDCRLLSIMFMYPMTFGAKVPSYMRLPATPGAHSLILPEDLIMLLLDLVALRHAGYKMTQEAANEIHNMQSLKFLKAQTVEKGRSHLAYLRQLNRELGGGFFEKVDKEMVYYTQRIIRKSKHSLGEHEVGYLVK